MLRQGNNPFYGEKLRLARTFNGFTLAELGEHVAVSRQYLQRVEVNPSISPNAELINALAEVLHVKPEFFFEPLTGEVREETCRFRKLKTTPKHIRNRAISYGTIFNLILLYLENEFDIPPVNIPSVSIKTREDTERASEKCRVRWKLLRDAPVHNMIRSLERAGIVTTTFGEVSDKIDAFSYLSVRPVIVRNTEKNSTSRARFDLAHELGHLVLHQGIEEDEPYLEEQANHFASAFLLPRVAFFQEFPRSSRINWGELIDMKTRWGVSLQAIIRRAYDLGIINAVAYRKANVYINQLGWRTNEPAEEKIPAEHPEIVPECFEMLNNQGVSPGDIAYMLYLTVFILEKFGLSVNDLYLPKNNVVSFEKARLQRAGQPYIRSSCC
ncbi:MAG: ImmA/IrrE family metallo-endopeptidase [Desulfobacterales bacterium]|nr:ImmA/IrrE family metallo-endopeptidase [Desulfobacterales bacterium]